jgi:hypothetical protein
MPHLRTALCVALLVASLALHTAAMLCSAVAEKLEPGER